MTKNKYKLLDKSEIEKLTVEDNAYEDVTTSLIQTSEIPHVEADLQSQNTHQKNTSDYIKGIILIILVDILWIVGSEIVQTIFYTKFTLEDPYILTYITNSIFILYLTKSFILFLWNGVTCKIPCEIPEIDYFYCTVVVALCFLWFLSEYLYNYSFQTISVASNTVLSNSTSLFSLFFSTFILGEVLTKKKMLSVLLSILGIIFIAVSDNDNNEKFVVNIGDLWCLLSSFFYAIYSVLLTKYISSDEPITILYGRMSCLVLVIFGLPRFIMFGFDMSFQDIPPSLLLFIILKALFTNFISDILYAKSVLLTSPTVASLGLTLSIPIAFFLDFILNKPNPTLIAIIGAILMVIGFVLMNYSSISQ